MKKLLTTLYSGSLAVIYYIDITENKRSFVFRPSLYYNEYPRFILHLEDGQLKEEGTVNPDLLSQAKAEINWLLALNLVENVHNHIARSFL